MPFDINALVVGTSKVGVKDSKGNKHRATVTKVSKRDKMVTVSLDAIKGKSLTLHVDKLVGLQGRPAGGAAPAAPAPKAPAKPAPAAPAKPAPKAPAAPSKPAPAAPAKGAKTGPAYADVLERLKDLQAGLADITNALYDVYAELEKFDPSEAEPAPKGGKGAKAAPMAAEDDEPNFD